MAESMTAAIQLIGVDVDGTLVGASGEVLPVVWDAALRARESGIHVALCSGRPAFGVALEYARRLDPSGWHIFQNGASIVHLGSDRSLSVAIPPAPIKTLIEAARSNQRVLELYGDSDYVTESASAWAREHAQLLGIRSRHDPSRICVVRSCARNGSYPRSTPLASWPVRRRVSRWRNRVRPSCRIRCSSGSRDRA